MRKKLCAALPLLLLGAVSAFAQEGLILPDFPQIMPKGLETDIHFEVNLFGLEKSDKSDVELRRWAGQDVYQKIFLPGARDAEWVKDAGFSINYDGGFFGGSLGVGTTTQNGREEVSNDTPKFNSLKAWLMPFGQYLRLTAGIGIGSTYADSLGADPGLRIYDSNDPANWKSSINTDNITQDNGLLLEGFIGSWTLGVAAFNYIPSVFAIDLNPTDTDASVRHTQWDYIDQVDYSYGARVGYDLGQWGKVNAAYLMQFKRSGTSGYYTITPDKSEAIPNDAAVETAVHMFGLYGSLTPMSGLGLTLAYNGNITKYLDEIYRAGGMKPVTQPLLYQQAVSLNARYTGINLWTFRTDHNFSFWTDKNFSMFEIEYKDRGLLDEATSAQDPDIAHFLLWNGLGASYQLTKNWKIDLYVRNLYRSDEAEGLSETSQSPQTGQMETKIAYYKVTRNEFEGELKGIWAPNANLEFYVGVKMAYLATTISADIHRNLSRNTNDASKGFISMDAVKDTLDSTFTIKIPIGMTVKIR